MSEKPVILVVDDDVPILTLMEKLLSQFGFEAVTAYNGATALEAARVRAPRLILLDKNIPGTAPRELIKRLRAEDALEEVPIVIVSGEAVDHDEIARLGANGAVQKPFDVLKLVERIRSYLA
jgi:DNA-binding response OmpR family regulator